MDGIFGGLFSNMGEGISGMFGGLFGGRGGGDSEGMGAAKGGLFARAGGAKDDISQGRGSGGATVESFLDDDDLV